MCPWMHTLGAWVECVCMCVRGYTLLHTPTPRLHTHTREVNAMIDFIQEHATKPFTVEKEPELELADEEEVKDEL